jgi:hypothetical protein
MSPFARWRAQRKSPSGSPSWSRTGRGLAVRSRRSRCPRPQSQTATRFPNLGRRSFAPLHPQDDLRPDHRLHLHHRHHDADDRRRGAKRRPLEDIPGISGRCPGASRYDELWIGRHGQQSASCAGTGSEPARHQMGPHSLQELDGIGPGAAQPPARCHDRRGRVGATGRFGPVPLADHRRGRAVKELARRADHAGSRLRYRRQRAERHRRAEGHGSAGRQNLARRLQEGPRRPRICRDDKEIQLCRLFQLPLAHMLPTDRSDLHYRDYRAEPVVAGRSSCCSSARFAEPGCTLLGKAARISFTASASEV